MTFEVPTIETERLVLRERTVDDFPAYAGLWADPDVVRHISGKPISEQDAWAKFMAMAGSWQLTGYGYWAVEEKATGHYVGEAGASEMMRDIVPSIKDKPEFGWLFAPSAQGKGYATEAIRAALAWADEHVPNTIFSCIIGPGNAPSLRVAEKCGFREVARSIFQGAASVILERPPK